ncbi:DUF4296 domain-containing protein [Robertkochia aurantiaca]|uniref:DUF4296 domain-containing protein n=1 Tax=Robertkochia aurantiaca TaxID=2873700 RepID=UPI001CC9564F|nr:DUF4296 domain-containing protein [Robertkochia sp. 3YJGBD-33]
MKRSILLGLTLIFAACSEPLVEKPENLIPPDKMTDILYDVAILDAAKGTGLTTLEENNIVPDTYIYTKYDIDSLQFSNSSVYYASVKPTLYAGMFESVEKRLVTLKDSIDQASVQKREENLKKREEVDLPEIKDSLQ